MEIRKTGEDKTIAMLEHIETLRKENIEMATIIHGILKNCHIAKNLLKDTYVATIGNIEIIAKKGDVSYEYMDHLYRSGQTDGKAERP